MLYIEHNGVKIPKLGFGTWKLEGVDCVKSVIKAFEVGYRHIDTAQIYGNEDQVGAAIEGGGVARKDIFLTTKIWVENLQDGRMQKSFDISLKKLKTDYVDMLLLHWPSEELSKFSEQMQALKEIKNSGKAKFIGVSNFTVAQMKHVTEELGVKIDNNQVEYHPYLSQNKVLSFITSHGMFMTAYSPLARGRVMTDGEIMRIADKYGKTPGQIALRWFMQQANVAAIPKSTSEKNIRTNFDIFNFELSADDMNKLNAMAVADGRIINPAFAPQWD